MKQIINILILGGVMFLSGCGSVDKRASFSPTEVTSNAPESAANEVTPTIPSSKVQYTMHCTCRKDCKWCKPTIFNPCSRYCTCRYCDDKGIFHPIGD